MLCSSIYYKRLEWKMLLYFTALKLHNSSGPQNFWLRVACFLQTVLHTSSCYQCITNLESLAENLEHYIPVIWSSLYRDLVQFGYYWVRPFILNRVQLDWTLMEFEAGWSLMSKINSSSPSVHPTPLSSRKLYPNHRKPCKCSVLINI